MKLSAFFPAILVLAALSIVPHKVGAESFGAVAEATAKSPAPLASLQESLEATSLAPRWYLDSSHRRYSLALDRAYELRRLGYQARITRGAGVWWHVYMWQ